MVYEDTWVIPVILLESNYGGMCNVHLYHIQTYIHPNIDIIDLLQLTNFQYSYLISINENVIAFVDNRLETQLCQTPANQFQVTPSSK